MLVNENNGLCGSGRLSVRSDTTAHCERDFLVERVGIIFPNWFPRFQPRREAIPGAGEGRDRGAYPDTGQIHICRRWSTLAHVRDRTGWGLDDWRDWTALVLRRDDSVAQAVVKSDIHWNCVQVNTHWRQCELWLNGFSRRNVTQKPRNCHRIALVNYGRVQVRDFFNGLAGRSSIG